MRHFQLWISLLLTTHALAGGIKKFSFPLPNDMDRADVYVYRTVERPSAILVLCPGCNGNGEELISQPAWQEYARTNNLGLIGISFASDVNLLSQQERGYYYASKGSGELLLNAIRRIYGQDLPLLIYGFSGGAQFTSRFMEWKPDRVISWCAYSAGWWDTPRKEQVYPPGIVACGDKDERNGASLLFFLQGRASDNRWLWISLSNTGHDESAQLEAFVMQYFHAVIQNQKNACWMDIDFKKEISASQASQVPALSAWLPNRDLIEVWNKIHGH